MSLWVVVQSDGRRMFWPKFGSRFEGSAVCQKATAIAIDPNLPCMQSTSIPRISRKQFPVKRGESHDVIGHLRAPFPYNFRPLTQRLCPRKCFLILAISWRTHGVCEYCFRAPTLYRGVCGRPRLSHTTRPLRAMCWYNARPCSHYRGYHGKRMEKIPFYTDSR